MPTVEPKPCRDRFKLRHAIRADVFNALITIGREIGLAAERGRRVGALLVVGDHKTVLDGSKQLIPNPLHGHSKQYRDVTDPAVQVSLIELSRLDGAFVIRADGIIQSAATYLSPGRAEISIPAGLGSRHMTAASVTARSTALAFVISATDGRLRMFKGGSIVLMRE